MTPPPIERRAHPPPRPAAPVPWRSLRRQFLYKLVGPLVLAFLGAATIIAVTNYRAGVQEQTLLRQQIMETFTSALIKPLWDCDDTTARGIMQALAGINIVQGVQLQDLCAKNTVEIGIVAQAPHRIRDELAVPELLTRPLVYRDPLNRRFAVGALSVQFQPFSIWDASLQSLAEQLSLFAVTVAAILAVVALVFRYTIERPLTHLHQAMLHQQTVHGNLPPARALRDELTDVSDVYDGLLQELQSQAQLDTLTGLGNRKALDKVLHHTLALASATRSATPDTQDYVLLLDLDGFKPINDTYGHAAGDAVLQAVAQRLRQSMRECDAVLRLGGDEFVIILHAGPPLEGLPQVLQRIAQALAPPIPFGEHQLHTGASIGHARIPQDGSSQDALLAHADHSMYAHKQARKAGR